MSAANRESTLNNRINTHQQANPYSTIESTLINKRIHTQQSNPHSTIESTLYNTIESTIDNRIDNRQPNRQSTTESTIDNRIDNRQQNRKMASLPASYALRMLRQPLNNRFTRIFRLRFVGGTRRNNKGDSTRRYLPRTQARSWSLSISGRGIAY